MIKQAVQGSEWLECDEWEYNFIDYPQVCQEFSKRMRSAQFLDSIGNIVNLKGDVSVGDDKIQSCISTMSMFYVCGRDHCDKFDLWDGIYGYHGVVAKTLVVSPPDSHNNNHGGNENCIVVNISNF